MAFRITGLAPEPFKPLFDLSDEALAAHRRPARLRRRSAHAVPREHGARRARRGAAAPRPRAPGRRTRRTARPMRSTSAGSPIAPSTRVDTVPEVMTSRLVAVRAFDARHMMIDADVSEGDADRGADRTVAGESRGELPGRATPVAAASRRGSSAPSAGRGARHVPLPAGAGRGARMNARHSPRCCRSSFPPTTRRPRSRRGGGDRRGGECGRHGARDHRRRRRLDRRDGGVRRGCGARVVPVAYRQIAATRNAGARAALGDAFVFVDADTLIGADVVAA